MKQAVVILSLLALLVAGAACATNQSRRQGYVKSRPELSAQTRQDILSGHIRVGMSEDQVRASLGSPTEVRARVLKKGLKVTWVYGKKGKYSKRAYVYFLEGEVTGWRY